MPSTIELLQRIRVDQFILQNLGKMGKYGKACLENQGSIANSTPDGENDPKK